MPPTLGFLQKRTKKIFCRHYQPRKLKSAKTNLHVYFKNNFLVFRQNRENLVTRKYPIIRFITNLCSAFAQTLKPKDDFLALVSGNICKNSSERQTTTLTASYTYKYPNSGQGWLHSLACNHCWVQYEPHHEKPVLCHFRFSPYMAHFIAGTVMVWHSTHAVRGDQALSWFGIVLMLSGVTRHCHGLA